jgi:hypothetical protein
LKSLGNIFIDSHDHSLIGAFDQFQQKNRNLLRWHELLSLSFSISFGKLYQYFDMAMLCDYQAFGVYIPKIDLLILCDIELQCDDEKEHIPELALREKLLIC